MSRGHKPGARYKKLVDVRGGDECWPWLGSVNSRTGYGKKQWLGETWLAHRWVYTMLCGSIPEGMTVDHICRNRRCVNPAHLRAVTQAENCRTGGGAKLTADDVAYIRSLAVVRGDRKAIAEAYGVSVQTISNIRAGVSWR